MMNSLKGTRKALNHKAIKEKQIKTSTQLKVQKSREMFIKKKTLEKLTVLRPLGKSDGARLEDFCLSKIERLPFRGT